MTERRKTEDLVEDIKQAEGKKVDTISPIRFNQVVSTGSTLLDLAISGGRVWGGGIPGGIYLELFGPPSTGKTALMIEIAGSVLANGGEIRVNDGEGRLDTEYSSILGVDIDPSNLLTSETVNELEQDIMNWTPKNPDVINAYFFDSLASYTSDWEKDDKDEHGMRSAKLYRRMFRRLKKKVHDENIIIVYTNMVGEGPQGERTSGGKGPLFWSSVRVRTGTPARDKYIKKNIPMTVRGKSVQKEKIIGIRSQCSVKKNSVDEGFREADVYIRYGYGVDDVRGNLQYIKDMMVSENADGPARRLTKYDTLDGESFRSIEEAIHHVEEANMIDDIRKKVVEIWSDYQEKSKPARQMKKRW